MTVTPQGALPTSAPSRAFRHASLFLLGLAALALCAAASLALGARSVPLGTVTDALFGDAHGRDALVVTGLRLPRTVIGLAVGAALGVAGAIAQGITRNPLASPTTLGVNAGAGFAVAVAIYALNLDDPVQYVWFAFAGATGAALFAQALARRGGDIDPVRLALGGTILQLVLLSWTSAVMLLDQRTLDEARFWLAGSLAGRPLDALWPLLPALLLGLALALVVSPALNTLALGDDAAQALGVPVGRVRLAGGVAVVLLAGSAVAVAENLKVHAEALGLENEAATKLKEYETQAAALGAAIQKKDGALPTASVVRFVAGPTRLYQTNSYSGVVLADIGLQRPASQVSTDPKVTMKDVSPEEIDQADANIIFVTTADTPDKTQQKQVTSNPVWKDLAAVKDGKVFEVADETWMSGIGVQAAEQMLADVADAVGVPLPAK